jgi:RNA polymerase sigma factor (sigma-70 family)
LDKPINVTGGTALVETLVDHRADIEKSTLGDLRDLEGLISNPTLHGAYMSLSEKQKRILNLYYVMELNDTQIAKKLKLSQQSVSKTRKQAISNIKKVYLDRMQHQKLE